jgi:thiamine biosynthesis lipoprotein
MGITSYLIEIGGEIICKGLNSKGKEWSVAIDKPIDGNFIPGNEIQTIIELTNAGLVTSGNYRKFYIVDGEKYSHTINPTTGYPVKHNLLSATVIAPTAAMADAYATYLMVIGLEKAQEFLAATPQMEALLVYSEGEELKVYSTDGVHQRKLK